MKKLFFFCAMIKILSGANAQSVIRGEYFVNADFGYGNGTSFVISNTGEDVAQALNIPFSAFPGEGYHFVFFRTRDSNGLWSQTTRRLVHVGQNTADATAVRGEYFIDEDYGVGSGTTFNINPSSSDIAQGLTIPFNAFQSPGYHYVFFRTLDIENTWSSTARRLVQVDDQLGEVQIANVEYFFDNDLSFGSNAALVLTASSDSTWQILIPPTELPQKPNWTFANDSLFLRVKENTKTSWGITTRVEQLVCSAPTDALISGPSLVCNGESASFIASADSTNNSTSYSWTGPGGFSASEANSGEVASEGTYTCIISNGVGCTVSVSHELHFYLFTRPNISITGPTAKGLGETVNLIAVIENAIENYSITWLKNGIPFFVTTPPGLSASYNKGPEDNDTITAVLGNSTGVPCYPNDTSAFLEVHLTPSGTWLKEEPRNLSIYPNPASTFTTISKCDLGSAILSIYNSQGALMKKVLMTDCIHLLSTVDLPAGLYVVFLDNKMGNRTKQLLVID
jgi:hypothetical protein